MIECERVSESWRHKNWLYFLPQNVWKRCGNSAILLQNILRYLFILGEEQSMIINFKCQESNTVADWAVM